jgi:DeoR family deoxyribose operon repressor
MNAAAARVRGVNKNERIKTIINHLRLKNAVSIKELTRVLGVSEMTIRRDLNMLAGDSVVELIPGGAIFKTSVVVDGGDEKYLIANASAERTREKVRIGQRAASMIEPHDTVALDVGSTTEYVAKFVQEDIPVTVLCFSLNILTEIYRKKNCGLIFVGGYFHDNTLMFESQEGLSLIKRTRVDKAFIAAAGVHETLGVTCANPYEIDTKKAALESAKTRILVADSSKFGKTRVAYFAQLREFNIIITDSEIPEGYRNLITGMGIELIVV